MVDVSRNYRIGIGTLHVPAAYKLAVGVNIICEELVVKLKSDWPDYVFKKDYKLMSLRELSEFIKLNNHLPGLPSANSIETTKEINVGEMQQILLQKIEELTLYILEQDRKIEKMLKQTKGIQQR